MLASLFRGSTGQRNSQHIESVTDDAHTRGLLFGHAQQVFNLATSPPPSPFASPTLRPGSFDDRAGLDLEEKDVRVLLAQDVFSGEERPTLLFDSRRLQEAASLGQLQGQGQGPGHAQNEPQQLVRSPLPSKWRAQPTTSKERYEDSFRNRSSTFSEPPSSWSKVNRDVTSKDDPFLECMFGVPSSAKTSSSTKMHIIPAKNRTSNGSERGPRRPSDYQDMARRAPLTRAYTFGQQPTLPSLDLENRDALLITRLFHVALDETVKIVNTKENLQDTDGQQHPAKLIERRAPTFAIGLVVQLPLPTHRPQSASVRLPPSSSYGQSLTSAASSYGSDLQSSWSLLDAIPTSPSVSGAAAGESDRRLDKIVENWDIVLRSISSFERIATRVVDDALQRVISFENAAQSKMPKGKFTRRDNQRTVGIHATDLLTSLPAIRSAAEDVSRRIAYAVRIPRVLTGIGFVAGHWTEEARMLHRIFVDKQQGSFLFNLLTAFLGNNVQWLQRLAPEWYRKQFQDSHTRKEGFDTLAARTIIVSETKTVARRLIFILASFLPAHDGTDGLRQWDEDSVLVSSLSPSARDTRHQRRLISSKSFGRGSIQRDPTTDHLSTSASSRGSQTSVSLNVSPKKQLLRRDSSRFDIAGNGIRSMLEGGAGTTSAVMTQHAATPAAYISVRNSYFPENAIVETNDSLVTADLSKMLNRSTSSHRRTSSASTRWGSLVSGISEIWSNRQGSSGDRGSITTASHGASPALGHKRATSTALSISRGNNPLQMMVDELDQHGGVAESYSARLEKADPHLSRGRATKLISSPPRLQVDAKDGVVDVEIDLPGFISAVDFAPPSNRAPGLRNKVSSFGNGGADSLHSIRSMAGVTANHASTRSMNVGGYLRRHHEDFMLHAVRPYNDLFDDIRRSMRDEPTPPDVVDRVLRDSSSPTNWISICTTLVADTRNFSITRFTLRRKFDVPTRDFVDYESGSKAGMPTRATPFMIHQDIMEDKVIEFDATLADAVEKVLNLGLSESAKSVSTRSHSRNVSTGSERINRLAPSDQKQSAVPKLRLELSRSEQRDLVVGALENVVRSVNAGLNQHESEPRTTGQSGSGSADGKRENALREGVRNWMLNVEHTTQTVW